MRRGVCLESERSGFFLEEKHVPGSESETASSDEWHSNAEEARTEASKKRDSTLGEGHEGAIDTEGDALLTWADAFTHQGAHVGHSETIGDSEKWDDAIYPDERWHEWVEGEREGHDEDGDAENLTLSVATTDDAEDDCLSDDNPKTDRTEESTDSALRETEARDEENANERGEKSKARRVEKARDVDWSSIMIAPRGLDIVNAFPEVEVLLFLPIMMSLGEKE